MSLEITEEEAKSARKPLERNLRMYVTVLMVDIEFITIAIAMSVISDGSRLGGSLIGSKTNSTSC